MKLMQILEEISVGYNQNDAVSKHLKKLVMEIRDVLEKDSAILQDRQLRFSFESDNLNTNSKIFLQGSFACSLAIKHKQYEVDADIGLYIDEILDLSVREKLFRLLKSEFSNKYDVVLKKPCITVECEDGYKIDIALYSMSGQHNEICHHNSIMGYEQKSPAKPVELVNYFKSYLSEEQIARPVLRLLKHFVKTASANLRIPDNNCIPSISLSILASQKFTSNDSQKNEEVLEENLIKFIYQLNKYIQLNRLNGPSLPEYYVSNTFYKIDNLSDVEKVLIELQRKVEEKNYANLVSKKVYQSIVEKSSVDSTPSLIGTMG